MGLDLFKDTSCVTKSSDAILQGVVSVTPWMKTGSRPNTEYFDGIISDDKGSLRMYGHDASARDKLSEVIDKSRGKGVVLQHCEVKQRQGHDLEVIINSYQLAS